jgi:polyvinyl alcohol dehydrogenase (cytochrome)
MLTKTEIGNFKMRNLVVFYLLSLPLLGLQMGCSESSETHSSQAEKESTDEPATLSSTDEFQRTSFDFGPREEMPGAQIYQQNCAHCHDGTVSRAPHFIWLEMMTPKGMLRAMTDGVMKTQSAMLSEEDRRHIVEYVTRAPADQATARNLPMCADGLDGLVQDRKPVLAGWGHDTARFTTAGQGGFDREAARKLKLKWSFAYPGALRARSQPAVGYGAVYTGSQDGTVYAFDLETGCVRWAFDAAAEVRTGIVLTNPDEARPLAVFGDILAWLYAVDPLTGELVWKKKADDHPGATLTGTAALDGKQLYVPVSSLEIVAAADPAYVCCSFRGKVLALNVETGAEIWTHYAIPTEPSVTGKTPVGTEVLSPSGAPVWSSPAIDRKRNRLYFGTGENYSTPADGNSDAVIAVDLTTGERVWQRQSTAGDAWNVACMMAGNPNCPPEDGPDFDHGSSMILMDVSDTRQILAVGHKNGTVFALDPDDDGQVLWQIKVGRGSIQGGIHFGMAAEGTTLYAPINDMNDTRNGDVLDPVLARPGLTAIDVEQGTVVWSHLQENICGPDREFCDPGISAPVTASPGVVFAGHLDGYLRAYDKENGDVLWQYNTAADHSGVNGIVGRGGGISGAGPTVADGYLVINSGYGLYFHEAGNLLMVFSPDMD